MEHILRKLSEGDFPAILQVCPFGVGFCRNGTLAAANASLLRLLDAGDPSQVQGRPLSHFVAPGSAAAFENLLRQEGPSDPRVRTGEVSLLRLDGSPLDAEVTVYQDRDGHTPATVLYVRDLSGRKSSGLKHKTAREELEKLVTERTAIAAERLMQLRAMAVKLTSIEHAERRRMARVLHDRVQQSLIAAKFALAVMPGRAENHATHAAWKSICQLLDDAIECSRNLAVELCPPVLYTSGLPEALAWLVRQKEKSHGLVVELAADPEAKPASDEVAAFLYEAVNELLFNVIKHAGVKRARVSLGQNGNFVEIEVSDQGVGFNPSYKKEPNGGATGLGLVGIRERLLHLGYGFRLESEPGKGTRVWLSAPKHVPKAARDSDLAYGVLDAGRPEPAPRARAPGVRLRVLLVEDHEIVRKGVRQLLEEDPAIEVVGEAADGRTAVEMALDLRPDVIVMDVVLPKLDGIQATRRIAARLPGARIIGLSVYAQEEMARQMLKSGAQCYLAKGGPVEALLAAVKDQVGSELPKP
ncbi:MAG: response regulator [Planctomycetes bacterium]|nr:response regulator [Planctomycetota bacterium]